MYVNRNDQGEITTVFANPQYPGQEYVEGAEVNVTINYSVASKLSVMRYLKSTNEWTAVRTLLDNNQDAKEEWDAASELHIDDPTLLQMAQVLGWDQAKLQLIFNEAALSG